MPKIPSFEQGYAMDIQTFWTNFIEPRLPNIEIVEKWNNLLQEYSDVSNAVFPIRAFYNWDKDFVENEKDDELRRGFYTKFLNENFSYFFTDNYFVAYIEKMALDNFCPTLNEFKEMMISRKFPARFGQSCSTERKKAAYIITGKNPGINTSGYKIAHIIDTGTNYLLSDGVTYSLKELSEKFDFSRGKYSEWQEANDNFGKLFLRISNASNSLETRKVLKAHFLRLANPLNYFLTPKMKKDGTVYNEYRNNKGEIKYDIAEYKNLQNFVHEKFLEKYGAMYSDYLKLVKLPNDFFGKSNANEKICIHYGNPLDKNKYITRLPDDGILSRKRTETLNNKRTIKRGEPYTENEIIICTYIARYGATAEINEASVHKICHRSICSIKMKIQNIASMLDEEGVNRFTTTNALTGLTTGQTGRRTNWEWVKPLCSLSKAEFKMRCKEIIENI